MAHYTTARTPTSVRYVLVQMFPKINKGKIKLSLHANHEGVQGSGDTAPLILTSALHKVQRRASRSDRFTPGQTVLGAQLIGAWVGPGDCLDF